MRYDIDEHKHRFAVWTAGRAYARGGTGGGYSVANAKRLIEESGLSAIKTPDQLPEPEGMDQFQYDRIEALIKASEPLRYIHGKTKLSLPFLCTYGRAQKLVNIYLKTKFVCAGHHHHPSVRVLHPPLDRVLLQALVSFCHAHRHDETLADFRAEFQAARAPKGISWTEFDKEAYRAFIDAIKTLQRGKPLWAVEEHWKPEREQNPGD